MIYRIVILGPQGSGKGTQGKLLSEKLSIPLISAGALWRKEIAQGTELGKKAEEVVRQGILAPDEWTANLVRRRLQEPDAQKGFILDGYPRNRGQHDLLNNFISPTHVIALTLSDHDALKRLTGRLVCPKCGANYHVVYNPPKQSHGEEKWYCDEDQTILTKRDDDKPEAIQERLHIYRQETEPLLELYRPAGILHEINSAQTIEQVFKDIATIFL